MEPLFRLRAWKETASLRASTTGRPMRIRTAPMTRVLLFMSSMPIPRERQRGRGESHQGDSQNRNEREEVGREKQGGDDPYQQAIESEHDHIPTSRPDEKFAVAEQPVVMEAHGDPRGG